MPPSYAQEAERRPSIAVVASLTSSLVNFRLELLRSLVANGLDVYALAPDDDRNTVARIEALGVRFIRIPMARTTTSPIDDLKSLFALLRIFIQIRPDIVLPYTMKPIIYGCLAARLARVPRRFALVTGLGYVFIEREPRRSKLALRWLSVRLYRMALHGVEKIFVYNEADAADLRDHAIASDGVIVRVPGSGVDTAHFAASPPPDGPPVFIMVARLLRDKGVGEYVAAARMLRRRYPDAHFRLLGPFDSNPAAISRAEMKAWIAEGVIEYLGETGDVRPYLADCSVFVLPSYREGMSRTVLEAMATGRAVVTSNGPGCAEPVEDGVSGLVVRVKNAEALAAAMERFIVNPELARNMGAAARERVEALYDVAVTNRTLLAGMRLGPAARTNAMPSAVGAAESHCEPLSS